MTIDEAIKHCEDNAEMYDDRRFHVDNRPDEVKELDYALGEAWEKAGIQREEIDIFNPQRAADENRQLAEWLTELKDLREENKVLMQECDRLIKEKGELLKKSEQIAEYKRLLKVAIKDIGDMSRYCLGMCCDSCPQIHTLSRGYQSCIWQHEDEALKLLND